MSEEMNLYKRCKNIFKAHGVDMGSGGSGGNDDVFVVTFSYDENEEIQCDRTPDEITEAVKDKSIIGLLELHEGDGAAVQTAVYAIWLPGFAEKFQFCAFNEDSVSVMEIDYDDDADAWTTSEFEYESGGAQYDFVIVSEDGETYSFETGSYNAIVSKIINSDPVTGIIRIFVDEEDAPYYSVHQIGNVQYACIDPEEDKWFLGVIGFGAETNFQLIIHEDNTITSPEDDAEG